MEVLGPESEGCDAMSIRCPQCNRRIIEKSGDAFVVRAQGKMVFDESGACTAQCFFCKSPVSLPLELNKSIDVEPSPRFVIRRPIVDSD